MRDLSNNIVGVASIAPVVLASDTDGTGVDLQGFESATVVLSVGIEGVTLSTTIKIEFELEESTDNSTFTDVTSATSVTETSVGTGGLFFTADGNADIPAVTTIGYVGGARYIRVVANFSGTHGTGTPISATVIKGHPRHSTDA